VKKRLEPAIELSGQPVKRGTMAHKHIVYMMLVDSAAMENDANTILKFAPLLEELAMRDQHMPYLAISYRSYGVVHKVKKEYEKAATRYHQALEIFDGLGMVWQKGRTLYELGELAKLAGENDKAEEYLALALDLFEGLNAKPDIERTKLALMDGKPRQVD
jgi:tetratricopeptide (TPR) repeat protein